MNSQQRRKEKRRRLNNTQFKINDVVRIDHKHEDDYRGIDTFRSRIVTGLKWDSQSKDLHYELDNDKILFPENYLILDIKEEKRKMF